MDKYEIISKVIDFQSEWDKYPEKSWQNIALIYDKRRGAGSDNVVWMWKEAADLHLPNLQGSYWCAIWQFMSYVRIIGLEQAQKLFHQTWFINCQSFYETFRALERSTGKVFIYKEPAVGRIYLHWNGVKYNHTENVIKVNKEDNKFWTNGGNTTISGAAYNGGGIYHMKQYNLASSVANGDVFVELDWAALNLVDNNITTYKISTGVAGVTIEVEDSLNIRSYPKEGEIVGTLHNGDKVFPCKKAFIMGEPWYFISNLGWFSAKYVTGGWILEESLEIPKWWYIHKGYSCTIGEPEKIDGLWYMFDTEGYMLENCSIRCDINASGKMFFNI